MSDAPISAPIRKIAHIKGRAGASTQLREALAVLERETRREPGCVAFSFFQAISDDTRFLLLEHFADQAALQAHLQLPHTLTFFAAQLVESVHAVDVPTLG